MDQRATRTHSSWKIWISTSIIPKGPSNRTFHKLFRISTHNSITTRTIHSPGQAGAPQCNQTLIRLQSVTSTDTRTRTPSTTLSQSRTRYGFLTSRFKDSLKRQSKDLSSSHNVSVQFSYRVGSSM